MATPNRAGRGRYHGPFQYIHLNSTSSYAVGSSNGDVIVSSTPRGGIISKLHVLDPSTSVTLPKYTLTIDGTSSAMTFESSAVQNFRLDLGFNERFNISCSSGANTALLTYTTQGATVIPAAALGNYALTILADSPVSYWRLGELTGTNAVDTADGNSGTYTNGPTLGFPSAIPNDPTNSSVNFVGASSQFVTVPDAVGLRITGDISIEAWINPQLLANGLNKGIVFKGNSSFFIPSPYSLYVLGSATGYQLTLARGNNTVGGTLQDSAQANISLNRWFHCVGTMVGTSASLYVNGANVANGTISTTIADNGDPVNIASRSLGNAGFTGLIDEVALYNKALSSQQVLHHYQVAQGLAV